MFFFMGSSHGLEVIALLDAGLALAAHGAAQLLAGGDRGDRALGGAGGVGGQVDGLALQGDLGREGLEVALGHELRLQGALALRGEAALFLRFG